MTEETQENPFEMINGSQCYSCYAVIAEIPNGTDGENGTFKLAIRPLSQLGRKQSFFGFRIRAVHVAPTSDDTDVIPTSFATGEDIAADIAAAFPNIPFNKKSNERCSLVGGTYVNLGKYQAGEISGWFEENALLRKMVIALKEGVPGVDLINEDALQDFLWTQYAETISQYAVLPEEKQEAIAPVVNLADWKAKQEFAQSAGGNVEFDVDQGGFEPTSDDDELESVEDPDTDYDDEAEED